MRRAVVDVGSNSVLLTVAERDGGGWRPLRETSEVTWLGQGTRETGLLGEEGMAQTLAALARAFATARELGVAAPHAAATMAARIARNTPDFLARADAQGTPVRVLSGEEEADLGFRAVADDPAFAAHPRLSIVDVGGQSTEIVTASRTPEGWRTEFRRSFAVGTLALKGSLLKEESPNSLAVLQAATWVTDQIGLAFRRDAAGYAVALGATGTNLVALRERMTAWDPARVHGAYLDFEEVGKAVGWLMPMTDFERRNLPGMEPGRERTLPAGALILERCLDAMGVPGCGVSVRGWRHALLAQLG